MGNNLVRCSFRGRNAATVFYDASKQGIHGIPNTLVLGSLINPPSLETLDSLSWPTQAPVTFHRICPKHIYIQYYVKIKIFIEISVAIDFLRGYILFVLILYS